MKQGVKSKGSPSRTEKPGKGKNGRVNANEPLMRPRYLRSPERLIRRCRAKKQVRCDLLKAIFRLTGSLGHQGSGVKRAPTPFASQPMRNVITPMGSDLNDELQPHSISKPTARKAEFSSGEKMSQQAKASSRKATGNRLDKVNSPRRKAADLGQG